MTNAVKRLLGYASETTGRPDVIEVDDDLAITLREHASEAGELLEVTPYRQEVDYGRNKQFLRAMHRVEREGRRRRTNASPSFAFEMRYGANSGELQFRFSSSDDRTRRKLRRQLNAYYHDSDVEGRRPVFVDADPGQYLAAAELELTDPYLKPLNNYKLDPEAFGEDPYNSIVNEMVGNAGMDTDATVITQIVLKPAISGVESPKKLNWWHGANKLAENIEAAEGGIRWIALVEGMLRSFEQVGKKKKRQGRRRGSKNEIKTTKENFSTDEDRQAAQVVANQRNKTGYHLNVRVVALADTPELARERVEDTAEKYEAFYNAKHGQGLRPVYQPDGGVKELLDQAAKRAWTDDGITQGLETIACLGHPPSDLNSRAVEYTHRRADQGAPASHGRFEDYQQTDVDRETNRSDNTADKNENVGGFEQYLGGSNE